MIVKKDWEDVYESDESVNYFRVVVIIGCTFVLFGGVFLLYRSIKDKHRLPSYLGKTNKFSFGVEFFSIFYFFALEASDEEDSAEELFSVSPSKNKEDRQHLLEEPSTSHDGTLIDLHK